MRKARGLLGVIFGGVLFAPWMNSLNQGIHTSDMGPIGGAVPLLGVLGAACIVGGIFLLATTPKPPS